MFIPGRSTIDNIIVAQEVLKYMNKTKTRKGVVAVKIDMEKACDRVNWDFLQSNLVDFVLLPTIVSLIMSCVKSSSLSIIWSGSRLEGFAPIAGLRQWYLISSYLFVL